jgi:hypothetical protein
MKVPIGGGTPVALYSGGNGGFDVVVDQTNAYWISFGTRNTYVLKVPTGGGAAVPLVSSNSGVGYIAIDATSVYWTTSGGAMNTGMVMKAPH